MESYGDDVPAPRKHRRGLSFSALSDRFRFALAAERRKAFQANAPPSQYTIARDYFRLAVYGSLVFQRDRFLERYRLHNEAVQKHFRDNPNFRVLNTESELNWRNFSEKIEPPNLPFPRVTTPYIGELARVDGQRLAKARSLVRKDLEAAVKSSL